MQATITLRNVQLKGQPAVLANREYLAASLSVVSLLVSLRKMRAGRMVQTQEPMVEPTSPST